MWRNDGHASDETFLLAIDHELSCPRQQALDQHLHRCERCRSRLAQIASVADDASRRYRHDSASRAGDPEALRERLQTAMADLTAALDQSWWFRLRRGIAALPLATRIGASLALIVLVFQLAFAAQRTLPLTAWIMTSVPIASEWRPIRALTPGAIGSASRETLCGGPRPTRQPVPPSVRQAVLREYRMEHLAEHEYELDYLITPELGGVADQRNLWPERYARGIWNARVKDDLEQLLPQLVCQGTLVLTTAQHDLADDWIAAYKKYFRTDRPVARAAGIRDDDDQVGAAPSNAVTYFTGARPAPVVLRVSLAASR
jgi:hypothetical protein